jgi:hypothetical protein
MTDHGEGAFFSLPSHGNVRPFRMESQASRTRTHKSNKHQRHTESKAKVLSIQAV